MVIKSAIQKITNIVQQTIQESNTEKAVAPVIRYLEEKHRIGLVEELRTVPTESVTQIRFHTYARTWFNQIAPEVQRICRDNSLGLVRAIGVLLPERCDNDSLLGTQVVFVQERIGEHNELLVILRLWEIPYIFMWDCLCAEDRQMSFLNWTDIWGGLLK